ncbi:MAG TPA: hypothetical protein VFF63_00325 [Candidatus Babeliales bacterium]|nr:hypothetical protein [Candidatus Babeliales bacterium]
MERFRIGRGAFVSAAAIVTLAACSQGAATPVVPQGAAAIPGLSNHSTAAQQKGAALEGVSGPWGVTVGDDADAAYGPSKMTSTVCRHDPHACIPPP